MLVLCYFLTDQLVQPGLIYNSFGKALFSVVHFLQSYYFALTNIYFRFLLSRKKNYNCILTSKSVLVNGVYQSTVSPHLDFFKLIMKMHFGLNHWSNLDICKPLPKNADIDNNDFFNVLGKNWKCDSYSRYQKWFCPPLFHGKLILFGSNIVTQRYPYKHTYFELLQIVFMFHYF